MNRLKVLFHVNESNRWQVVFGNINNFINDIGPQNADIEVLANGEAVSIFGNKCSQVGDVSQGPSCGTVEGAPVNQLKKLSEMGVKFVVCRNALKAESIDEDSLPAFVVVVPAGITEIAKKQAEGYAYIKP